jgi:hypothetical protein
MSTPIYPGTLDWAFSSPDQNKHFVVFVLILFGGVVFWFFLFLWLSKIKTNYFYPKEEKSRSDSLANSQMLPIPGETN